MRIRNQSGLSFDFHHNGSVRSIQVDPIRISLKASTPWSKAGTNLFLRKRGETPEFIALLGPESNSLFSVNDNTYIVKGSWNGLEYECHLQLSLKGSSWQWQVFIRNISGEVVDLDLIYMKDIGLKPLNSGLINEYYVSQYLERLVMKDENFGAVICCRQNMKESTGYPWLMIASKNGASSGSTDGMQFYGKSYRATGIPEALLSEELGGNCAGESPVIALQEKPFSLQTGETYTGAFAATYLPDHPEATSANDLKKLSQLFAEFDELTPVRNVELAQPAKNLFNTSVFLPSEDLENEELNRFFGVERRHAEKENGELLSFFCGKNNHVMLRAKEILADRPHAHIMQAKNGFAPDENIMSTTAFAFGVFNSHISQGNTNFNVMLSVCTSQFNQSPESGQRIFIEIEGRHYLLGVPSAFETGLNHCLWLYKFEGRIFRVRTWTSVREPRINMDFKVLKGEKVNLIITHDFDPLNGWKVSPGSNAEEFVVKPEPGNMITEKFPDAQFRIVVNDDMEGCRACNNEVLFTGEKMLKDSLFILEAHKAASFSMSFIGEVCTKSTLSSIENHDNQWLSDMKDAQNFWNNLSLNLKLDATHNDISAIGEILPWFGMNALTHFLTPYGLEQFSGAAWGTRDVSQGPVELLLTLEKYEEAREVLLTIFSNQNPDGGWPQWWMFDSYQHIRAGDSHGDVFYWVIIALSNYIKVTGDLSILDEKTPYFGQNEEITPVSEHMDKLIRMITDSFIPGTSLVPFGGGDWNDSLQPVSKELADKMISSWTVEMNYQAFMQYQAVFELAGNKAKAVELRTNCQNIKADFNKHLIKDGIVAGYGLVESDGSISVLLHPCDTTTGIHYSLLPMERGILSGIFTAEQAEIHLDLIEKHLKGPDGARLMDRPLRYKGGIQEIFQRAESSTFFGREIGLMYVHEHIRYAEAQARAGRAEAFVKALRQAIPVSYREAVPCGDFRQSNCYYSSSDVTFKTRYEADELYEEVLSGKLKLKGGWRVYSSGPGLYISLIVSRLMGLRIESGSVIIDPVMPKSFDGFAASLNFKGRNITFRYSVKQDTHGPVSIAVNGKTVKFDREPNPFRRGGAVISLKGFLSLLGADNNLVEIGL
jgi:cellobiose phosphorylase